MSKPKSTSRVVTLSLPSAASAPKRKQKKAKGKALTMKATPYMKLMQDPWTMETSNASRPDMNQEPTLVWREKGADSITTDSFGNSWLQFTFSLNDFYYPATFSDANTISALGAGVDINNYTELASTFSTFRPYALSVELEYVGANDAGKGVLFCCTTNQILNAPGDKVSSLVDESDYRETSTDEKVGVIKRLYDNDAFAAVTGVLNYGGLIPPVVVHVGGLGLPASTNCLRVRYCYVSEFQVSINKLMGHVTHRSATHPAQVHAAANMAGPNATTAVGSDPIGTIIKHSGTLLEYGAQLNGLWEKAKPLVPLMLEMGVLMA